MYDECECDGRVQNPLYMVRPFLRQCRDDAQIWWDDLWDYRVGNWSARESMFSRMTKEMFRESVMSLVADTMNYSFFGDKPVPITYGEPNGTEVLSKEAEE